MKKTAVILFLSFLSILSGADSLFVSGRIALDGIGLPNVDIAGTKSDSSGCFSFVLQAGSDTSITPRLNHYLFKPEQLIIHAQDSVLDSIYIEASRQIKKTLIISGQSNTGFNGYYQYYIPDEVDPQIPYYAAYAGVEHGLDVLGPVSNFGVYNWSNFGIEILLARTLFKQYTDSLAVMKIAWGGTSLILNWGEQGSTWTWFKEMHEHAVDSMHTEGYEPEYIGFFWYQGESDRTLERSSVYGDSLYRFVDRVREHFPNASEVDSLPFVCVRIRWNPASIYEEPVRQAQMDIEKHRAYTAWVDIDDCDPYRVSETNIHYNGIALNRIGYKLAAAYLDLVGHPVDSSSTVTIDLEGEIDSTIMLFVEGDTTFYDLFTSQMYQFPSKLGDSLSIKLLMPTQDYVSFPDVMTIPFVYDPGAILPGAYTFDVEIKTQTLNYEENVDFRLIEAFPNPFNPTTKLRCRLISDGRLRLDVYDVSGKKIATLIDRDLPSGTYDIAWNAGDLPSGIYIASLESGTKTDKTKLLILK